MTNRIVYRRRHSYATRSNRTVPVKTPGGRLLAQYVKKRGSGSACGDCGSHLPGIQAFRPARLAKISKRQKSISRAYGGSRCAHCVRERIVRAFLVEEQKIVKVVLKKKEAEKKKAQKRELKQAAKAQKKQPTKK